MQALERSVMNYEVSRMQQIKSTATHSDPIPVPTELPPAIVCPSAEQMLAQILKQNELITLLLANSKELKLAQSQQTSRTDRPDDRLSTKIEHEKSELPSSSTRSSGDHPQRATFSQIDHNNDGKTSDVRALPAKRYHQPTAIKWSSPAALPDIEWTEEDEMVSNSIGSQACA